MKNKKDYKRKKIIKIIVSVLVFVLIGELLYLGACYYKRNKDTIYYTFINSIVKNDNGYVGVGLSDFKHSKKYNLNDYSKAVVYMYNNNFNLTDEVKLDIGYHSYYNDIYKTGDNFIAVGAVEMSKDQLNNKASEGLIVKYDKDFNILWRKNIVVLHDTEFTKVKVLKNGDIIVVGQSIYDSGRVGNHKTGGAVIMRFDSEGNEIFRNNYTGPYTGLYTDVVIEKDGFVVSGVIRRNTGVVVKYDLKGNLVWKYHYAYTDELGFSSIDKIGNNYVLTGSKLDGKNKLSYYRGAVVVVDSNGKKVDSFTYKNDNITRFTDIIKKDDYYLVVGATGKRINNDVVTDALYVKLEKDFKVMKEEKLSFSNNESYNRVYSFNDKYYFLGYTNSKIKEYKTNGKDYYPIVKELD